jgi:hypothetical protein
LTGVTFSDKNTAFVFRTEESRNAGNSISETLLFVPEWMASLKKEHNITILTFTAVINSNLARK